MQHLLKINNIECFAYHGCMEEEGKIGGRFKVDLELYMDLTVAIETDDLSQTADYVVLHNVVREEMAIRSKLIEHVAGRILKRLQTLYPATSQLKVAVTKFNPPVNGQLAEATIIVTTNPQ
ncbi:dihydroneopterin aldolase [soil metagenome]